MEHGIVRSKYPYSRCPSFKFRDSTISVKGGFQNTREAKHPTTWASKTWSSTGCEGWKRRIVSPQSQGDKHDINKHKTYLQMCFINAPDQTTASPRRNPHQQKPPLLKMPIDAQPTLAAAPARSRQDERAERCIWDVRSKVPSSLANNA